MVQKITKLQQVSRIDLILQQANAAYLANIPSPAKPAIDAFDIKGNFVYFHDGPDLIAIYDWFHSEFLEITSDRLIEYRTFYGIPQE